MREALGVIETLGLATAIEAADASVKAANVELADYLVAGGGKVNIILRGDVAAVKASVEAGVASASQIGKVLSQTVIPRPSQKLTAAFNQIEPKEKYFLVSANVADTDELRHWLLSMGDHVTVLEPKALREEIKQTLRNSISWYED